MIGIARGFASLLLALFVASCATPPATTPSPIPPSAAVLSSPHPSVAAIPSIPSIPALRRWEYSLPSSGCARFYENGNPPIVASRHDFGELQEFCFQQFVSLHSTATRGAIWSAQHLTAAVARGGDITCRYQGGFRVVSEIDRENRASQSDYDGHGADWQIGHMVPANDMPNTATQMETFTFANAVPQASEFNPDEWAELEGQVHELAKQAGELFIVTGPIYADAGISVLNGRVGIPTHVFKAIYNPRTRRATVFIAENIDDPALEQISLARLANDYGIEPFPSLETERWRAWSLPPRRQFDCVPGH